MGVCDIGVVRAIVFIAIAVMGSACSFAAVRPSPTRTSNGKHSDECASYFLPVGDLILVPVAIAPAVSIAFEGFCGDERCHTRSERVTVYAMSASALALLVASAGYGFRTERGCRRHREVLQGYEAQIARVVELTSKASDAAAMNDCAAVYRLDAQVAAIDPWFHAAVFRSVPAIKACGAAPHPLAESTR